MVKNWNPDWQYKCNIFGNKIMTINWPRTFKTFPDNKVDGTTYNIDMSNLSDALNTQAVDTSTAQTIGGAKTFTGNVTLSGDGTAWEDLWVPLTSTALGALSKPDFDYTSIGYLFPQNDATEILYFIVQMPHRWKEGSTIYPHIHWSQSANQAVTWKIDYKWFNTGAAVPGSFTTLTMATNLYTYTSGTIHQKTTNTSGIAGTGKTISSLMLIKLYRNDNTYTGDALAYQFDIHYEVDSFGSNTESVK